MTLFDDLQDLLSERVHMANLNSTTLDPQAYLPRDLSFHG